MKTQLSPGFHTCIRKWQTTGLTYTFILSNPLYLMQVCKSAFLAVSSFISGILSLRTDRRWCIAEGSQASSRFMRIFPLLASQVNHFSQERSDELNDRSQQAEVRATYVFPTFTCSNCFLSFQHPSAFYQRQSSYKTYWQIILFPGTRSVFLLAP